MSAYRVQTIQQCSFQTGKYLRCCQVEGNTCMHCSKRPSCFDKAGIRRRVPAGSCHPAFFRGPQRVGTPEYLSMMRLRKIWAEGSFAMWPATCTMAKSATISPRCWTPLRVIQLPQFAAALPGQRFNVLCDDSLENGQSPASALPGTVPGSG